MGLMTENYIVIGFSIVGTIIMASLAGRVIAKRLLRRFRGFGSRSGMTGNCFVDRVVEAEELDVTVRETDEATKSEFILSEGIAKLPDLEDRSLLTLGISAHELAHAVQARNQRSLVAFMSLASKLSVFLAYLFPLVLVLGFVFYTPLLWVSLVIYLVIILLVITKIPFELEATRKALIYLDKYGDFSEKELNRLKKMLSLAILTRLTELTGGFLVLLDLDDER